MEDAAAWRVKASAAWHPARERLDPFRLPLDFAQAVG